MASTTSGKMADRDWLSSAFSGPLLYHTPHLVFSHWAIEIESDCLFCEIFVNTVVLK